MRTRRRASVRSATWIGLLVMLAWSCSCSGPPPAPPSPKVKVTQPVVRDTMEWDEFTARLEAGGEPLMTSDAASAVSP